MQCLTCLFVVLLTPAAGLIAYILTGKARFSLLVMFGVMVGTYVAVVGLMVIQGIVANRRCRRLIAAWITEQGLTNATIHHPRRWITPPELPSGVSWQAYDVNAQDATGQNRKFYIFITGTWGCTRQLRLGVTTDDDYISISSADFGGRPMHEVPPEELLRVMDEKQQRKRDQQPPQS